MKLIDYSYCIILDVVVIIDIIRLMHLQIRNLRKIMGLIEGV